MRGKKKTPTPSLKGPKISKTAQFAVKPIQVTKSGLAITNPKNEQQAIDKAVEILQAAGITIEERDIQQLAETRRIKVFYTPPESDNSSTKQDKLNMLAALQRSLGVVSTAVKMTGIARSTHYEWQQTDPGYKAYCDEITEMTLDFAESMLFQNMRDGKEASNIFYLKTRGKRRGYIETHHLLNEEVPIHVTRTIIDPKTIEISKK
jgi:hypothetical protein